MCTPLEPVSVPPANFSSLLADGGGLLFAADPRYVRARFRFVPEWFRKVLLDPRNSRM